MSKVEVLVAEVARRGGISAFAFVLSSAERAFPVILETASPETTKVISELLALLWTVPAGASLDAIQWRSRIRALPEASVDDSHLAVYFSMRALGLFADAIEATDLKKASQIVPSTSEGELDLAKDLDFRIRSKSGVELGLYRTVESAQVAIATKLLAADSGGSSFDSVVALSKQHSAAFGKAAALLPGR